MKIALVIGILFTGIQPATISAQQADRQVPVTKQPVLVELFTTEGCSDCPPADKLLKELKERQPVTNATIIPLGLHVDYFDQNGWKDRFSDAQFTERQKRYIKRFGEPDVFTPQIVVDGKVEVDSPPAALKAITQAATNPKPVQVLLERNGESLSVRLKGNLQTPTEAYSALIEDNLETVVKAGENRGSTLQHVAVVRRLERLGRPPNSAWTADVQLKAPLDVVKANAQIVVFLQDEQSGQIIGVGTIRL